MFYLQKNQFFDQNFLAARKFYFPCKRKISLSKYFSTIFSIIPLKK